ncbi:hypothetical protein FRC07_008222 [Ceratobasidium sp. 392]|nr:hypothetical protein FRC07_008222 [Ceratobasidium sp. 392]
MKLSSLAITLFSAAVVSAHTTVYGVWLNGVFQGDGRYNYIRSPPNNNPVKDLTSSAMACNVNNNPVGRYLPVKAGDGLTFEWYHDSRNDDIIAASHKGPVQVYIAPASSNGNGNVWVKIYSSKGSGSNWAVSQLIASHGQHTVKIPNIASGQYLLRAEIVALHEADVAYASNPVRGAQNYMSCVQIAVTSNGSALPAGVAFPGAYTPSTPGIVYNIYTGNADGYTAPGPAVSSISAGGSISQCGQGTRACLTTTNKKEGEQDRVVSVVPLAQSSSDFTIQPFSSDSGKGLTLILNAGAYPSDGSKQSLKVVMFCDKETQVPKLTNYDGSQATIEWHVVEACGSQSTGDPPKSGGGSSPSGENVGGSSMGWFFFILFLVIAAYFGLGAYHNYNQYGASGWDLVPHRDFWRDVPYLIRDLISQLFSSGRSSRGGYTSV